jgi:hypothetical protein
MICVLGVSIVHLFMIFLLDLELSRLCGLFRFTLNLQQYIDPLVLYTNYIIFSTFDSDLDQRIYDVLYFILGTSLYMLP